MTTEKVLSENASIYSQAGHLTHTNVKVAIYDEEYTKVGFSLFWSKDIIEEKEGVLLCLASGIRIHL